MADHYPMCPSVDEVTGPWTGTPWSRSPRMTTACCCGVIARVREDERERIATAIEALPIDHRSPSRDTPIGLVTFVRQEAYWRAARIARGGERDD